MIGPSRLVRGVRRRIEETLLSAPKPRWSTEAEAIADAILAQAEPGMSAEDRAGLRRRAEEVREIGRRLVRNLTRAPFRSFAGLPEGAVLVSESLRPADAALLDPVAAGRGRRRGGRRRRPHRGDAARARRAGGARRRRAGACHPAGRHRGGGRRRRHGGAEPHAGARWPPPAAPSPPSPASASATPGCAGCRPKPQDGEAVELQANLELPIELPLIAQSGAAGIGLLRTEFLFMNRETVPDEDTQAETYRTHRRGDGRRPGHHPRAGLGRREGHRGAGDRRHRAGGRRRQPGARPARHPPAAAPARAVRDPARRHPARRRWPGRCGCCCRWSPRSPRCAPRARSTSAWRGGCAGAASGCRTSCRRSAS